MVVSCLAVAIVAAVAGHVMPGTGGDSSEVVGAVIKSSSGAEGREPDSVESDNEGQSGLGLAERTVPAKAITSSLLEPKSWFTPPPPPKQVPATQASLTPAAPPAPPAFPFTYIGRVVDRQDVILFLSRNDTQYAVRANDTLDNNYRVDKITDEEAVLTYIPLNTQQTIHFGDGQGEALQATPVQLPQAPTQPAQPVPQRISGF